MFDFTIRAFNLSERFRLPVLVMADEVVGHMNERVVIPEEAAIELVERKRPTGAPEEFLPYRPGADGVAPMACFGDGYRIHVTGLTHGENGYPAMEDRAQERMVNNLVNKIKMNRSAITSYETEYLDDAEIVLVAYGISVRSARRAVRLGREQGLRLGLVKLNTVWPFPEEFIRDLAGRVSALIMPEINLGQMVLELERCAGGRCPVRLVGHAGGSIIRPGAILNAVDGILKEAV